MTRLEFGVPTSFEQAQFRLPESSHPEYDSDKVIEHLAHFRNHLDRLHTLYKNVPQKFGELTLEERFVPLSRDELTTIESVSYKRKQPPLIVREHAALMMKTVWNNFLPHGTGDESYGFWEIYKMSPDPEISDHLLACIMHAPYKGGHGFPPQYHRINPHDWNVEVGIAAQSELELLLYDLGRDRL